MVFRACRPGGRGLVSRLIAACFTAVISTHFALRLLPVFPRAPLWTALLFPDFQGAKPDLVFPFRRHWGSSLLVMAGRLFRAVVCSRHLPRGEGSSD
jgi:hypothetical protein